MWAAQAHLHCRNWKVRNKADGELPKRKKDLMVKAAERYPGEMGCASTRKPMKGQASHTNIFPGGQSLGVPCFLQAQSEATGVWFAEGLMSVTVMGAQSEMYAGYTNKALWELWLRVFQNGHQNQWKFVYVLCPQILS